MNTATPTNVDSITVSNTKKLSPMEEVMSIFIVVPCYIAGGSVLLGIGAVGGSLFLGSCVTAVGICTPYFIYKGTKEGFHYGKYFNNKEKSKDTLVNLSLSQDALYKLQNVNSFVLYKIAKRMKEFSTFSNIEKNNLRNIFCHEIEQNISLTPSDIEKVLESKKNVLTDASKKFLFKIYRNGLFTSPQNELAYRKLFKEIIATSNGF